MDSATLARVEGQRLELEQNIAKLRKSLRYWQTLEIDYEGLKEEFQGLPDDTPSEECFQAAKDFKPELVDDKELRSLFEFHNTGRKRPSQLVKILSDRVDYVTRNISTIRKQLSAAEKKRNALLLAEDPEHQEDAGLPLSEITEELDDQDKVISSKVQAPGKDTPGILDVLRRAGVTDLEDDAEPKSVDAEPEEDDVDENDANVSEPLTSSDNIKLSPSRTVSDSASRFVELSDSDEDSASDLKIGPSNPDDNEEDIALRRDMLQYNLGEVGAIVAELDLEESADHSYDEEDDDDDYLSDYDEDEDLYTDESEDEKGATKNPVITERYKRQMEALSRKHGISGLENLGPEPELPKDVAGQLNRPSPAEAARKAAIARAEASESSLRPADSQDDGTDGPQKKKKKSVAFAPTLDIAQEVPPPTASSTITEPAIKPVGEIVLERTPEQATETLSPNSAQPPSRPTKISRFKATRASHPQTPLFPPPQMEFPSPSATLAPPSSDSKSNPLVSPTLIERPASQTAPPSDPSDLNPEIHRREIAVEYQKLRNRKMHEQGGYVRGGAEENYGEDKAPDMLVDEESGKARKVSRFKAARLNQS